MQLFNIHDSGAEEIIRAVGLVSGNISFDTWQPVVPLAIRDVTAIIGREPVSALADHYASEAFSTPGFEAETRAVEWLQQAVACFAWLKIIPTLDAQHDATGRSRRLGENETGLTALQEFKDEENIRHMAYEAVDGLIECMEDNNLGCWVESPKYKQRSGLLIRSKEQFDEFFTIGSHRMFVTLLPILREVQATDIEPIIGRDLFVKLLEGETAVSQLFDPAARALALLTMKKAVERLPVEVIPEGIVQIQQNQPVNSRLRAEQSARAAVAASLGSDAARMLSRLQQLVAELINPEPAAEITGISRPLSHSKGFSF